MSDERGPVRAVCDWEYVEPPFMTEAEKEAGLTEPIAYFVFTVRVSGTLPVSPSQNGEYDEHILKVMAETAVLDASADLVARGVELTMKEVRS